jgi:hypothetical protein
MMMTEAKLEKAFREQADAFSSSVGQVGHMRSFMIPFPSFFPNRQFLISFPLHTQKGFRYVAFDFHKECGAKNYDRMSLLWDQVMVSE